MKKTWLKSLAIVALFAANLSSADVPAKSYYSRASVAPVTAEKADADTLLIHYRVPPESMMFSKGVDYVVKPGQIKVVISRQSVKDKSNPMAIGSFPEKSDWDSTVRIPYHGEKVIMVYSDVEEQVYP